MNFSVQQALAICTSKIAQRAQTRTTAYTLHCSNDGVTAQHSVDGITIKSLIDEFRRSHASYKFAFITRKGDVTVLRFYNSTISKKFFSMTRKGKKSGK